jgi:predicted ATP-grasp superfamily ATP-dependent carboligase
MQASLQGALNQLNRSYKAFEHNGKKMTKSQVRSVLEYGIKMGYTSTGQLTDKEVDQVLSNIKTGLSDVYEQAYEIASKRIVAPSNY